jgi:hypothetical protein
MDTFNTVVVADISLPEICAGAVVVTEDSMHGMCAGVEVCPEHAECNDILTGGEGKDDLHWCSSAILPSKGLPTMGSYRCKNTLLTSKGIHTPEINSKFSNLRKKFSEGEGPPANSIFTPKPRNRNLKNIQGKNILHGNNNFGSFSPAPVKRKIEHFENLNSNHMEDNVVMLTNTDAKRSRLSELNTRISTGLENGVSLIKVHQQSDINTGIF